MLTLTIIQHLDLHFIAALPSTLFQSTFHTSHPSPLQHSHAHLNISNVISYEQKNMFASRQTLLFYRSFNTFTIRPSAHKINPQQLPSTSPTSAARNRNTKDSMNEQSHIKAYNLMSWGYQHLLSDMSQPLPDITSPEDVREVLSRASLIAQYGLQVSVYELIMPASP